jgi:putative DNA primase/helicase
VKNEHLNSVLLSTVKSRPVDWLWPGRFARGKFTLISGDPKVGKSWALQALTMAFTTGNPFPGTVERRSPTRVIWFAAEDDPEDTVRPRLETLGADLTKVEMIESVSNGVPESARWFNLKNDLQALEEMLVGGLYGVIIFDPLNAYMPTELDSHQDSAVRSVLAPLAALARKYRVCMIGIRHLTKGSRDKAIYRGSGSIAYTAVARMEIMVSVDSDNPNRRLFAPIACNLAETPPATAFEVRNGQFFWGDEYRVDPDRLVAPEPTSDEATALAEGREFLRSYLEGGAQPAKDVAEAARKAGLSLVTLRRAKRAEAIRSQKLGYARETAWYWCLPKATQREMFGGRGREGDQDDHALRPENNDHLDHLRWSAVNDDDGEWQSVFEAGAAEEES